MFKKEYTREHSVKLSMYRFLFFSPEFQEDRHPRIKMPQQKDIVKIAIQMPGAYPQLIQLDQVSPGVIFTLAVSV